jgi:hypothetical protein
MLPQTVFVPIVWSTRPDENDKYSGYWRFAGRGMVSFFLSDTDGFGGVLPMVDKVAWGLEDNALIGKFQVRWPFVLCCAVLCCAVLCCAVLCCAVLCCAVLCCAVLCCAVLCWVGLG